MFDILIVVVVIWRYSICQNSLNCPFKVHCIGINYTSIKLIVRKNNKTRGEKIFANT